MIQAIQKLKNRKGFTLVELIVVLVILAILAALLVPALTGYIDKAKKEQIIAETRMVVMAAQTEIDEDYAAGSGIFGDGGSGSGLADGSEASFTSTDSIGKDVMSLAEVSGDFTVTYNTNGHVTKVEYSKTGGDKCTYTYSNNSGSYDVTTAS